jgi:hypothetical protein
MTTPAWSYVQSNVSDDAHGNRGHSSGDSVRPALGLEDGQGEERCGYLPLFIVLTGTAMAFYGVIAELVCKFV